MEKDPYRLRRDIVSSQSFEEANDHVSYWSDKTYDERLNAACFIINQIFQVTPATKVDKTVVHKRKHN